MQWGLLLRPAPPFCSRRSPPCAAVAARFRLLPTGGSDCHGMNKGEPLIGRVKLASDYVDRMKEAVAARKQKTDSE